jgi:hypothetical protein
MSRTINPLVLAFIALILAIGSIVFGAISYFTITARFSSESSSSGIKSTWTSYDYLESIATPSFAPIDDLNISITLNQGEWLLLSFSCYANSLGISSTISFRFYVGGEINDPMHLNYLDNQVQSISFEGILKNLPIGDYNITILATNTGDDVGLYQQNLIVHTLIP